MTKEKETHSHKLPGTALDIIDVPINLKILSSLLHSVPLKIFAKDLGGKFIFANRDYCQSIGKPLRQILGKTDYDIHPKKMAEKYIADDKAISSSRKTRLIEESWRSIGGEVHYVQVVKTPLVDSEDSEKVLGIIGVFWDITERKAAEIQAKEERNFLRVVIDSLPAFIYVKDIQGNFLVANNAVAEFMGAGSPDELIGKSDFDYYTADVAQSFADIEKKIITTEEPVNDLIEPFLFKNEKYWVNTSKSPIKNLEGQVIGLIGVGHDITHIKLIEEKLRESEERYAAVVNQALEGIFLLDPHTKKVLDSNESFRKMLGYSEKELQELIVYDFVIHDRSEVNGVIDKVISLEDYWIGERTYRHKAGYLILVEVSAKLISFAGKQAILVIVRDVSEKKVAEDEKERLKEQLRQAQKFEALGTLAGGVAHDLNNILSGIVGYPELLINKLPAGSELIGPLSVIHDSGVRASTVVADLLTIARSAASNKEVCSLNTLVREFIVSPELREIQLRYPDVKLYHHLSADPAPILCSSVHIKKCLMNLVNNASEAIESRGYVTIKVLDNSDDVFFSQQNFNDTEYIVLQVADSGPGIPEEDLERIFEPFYTKKKMDRSGTGLGLTVVWNTVNDHGGEITVESDSNGTCFNLAFPLSAEEITERREAFDQLARSENNEHILIVDDEKVLRDIAVDMLSQLGYRVDAVSSGELAVEFVKKIPVDLLLIDMLMGEGINGRETFQQILEIYPDVKALIVSGYSDDEDVQKALQAGARGFVQKPFLMSRLGQVVKDALQ